MKKRKKLYTNGGGFDIKSLTSSLGAFSGLFGNKEESELNQIEGYDVSKDGLTTGVEAGLGSNPWTSAALGVSKIGEGLMDGVKPGLGEGLFSPHKGLIRAFKEGKPEYAVPIVGSVLAANDAQDKLTKKKSDAMVDRNPFGMEQMTNGGELIKFNAPDHSQGGQEIDKFGNTNSTNPIAEIEKKETLHEEFVFSDTLKTKKGNTFAEESIKIDNMTKNNPISKKTRKFKLDLLKKSNNKSKELVENKEMNKYPNGGEIIPVNGVNQISSQDMFGGINMVHPNQVSTFSQANGTAVSTPNPLSVGLANLSSNATVKGVPTALSKGLTSYKGNATVKPVGGLPTTNLATITPTRIGQNLGLNNKIPLLDDIITNENTSKSKKESKGMDYLTPARVGKGVELAGKASILGDGYDKVNPQLNPESRKIKDIMSKRKVDTQAILNQINLSKNAALNSNNNARSLNVKRALDQRTFDSSSRQLVDAKLKENQANNNFRLQEASTLNNLGQQEVQARTYAEDATARNKGQHLTNTGTLLGDIGRAGAFETKVKVNDMQVAESLAILGNKYEKFGIDATTYDRLKKGKYTTKDIEALQNSILKFNE